MKILQVANKAIYPPDGGSLAILSISKGYIRNGHQVHLLNMVTHKHMNTDDSIEDEYKESLTISGVKINSRISLFKLLYNLFFSTKPYISERFFSSEFKRKLISLLKSESFDIVQLEGLYCLQYLNFLREIYSGKVLYRPHNMEYLIWKRNSSESPSIIKKIYFSIISHRLKKLESKFINTYDFLIPISQNDANLFKELGNKKPFIVSPFGIDIHKVQSQGSKPNNELSENINYIGALDWIPNQQGLLWFIEKCLPTIIRSHPNVMLNVAGRNAPKWFIDKLKHKNISYFGEVENANDFLQQSGPVIVPLFSGSGIRVKIIEGMALKKAIIATRIAAEGINCKHEKNILLADTPEEFSGLINKTLTDRNFQERIGDNAFLFVNKNYNFTEIASNILNFIK
ncbi:MAG: hypothetical protein C0597_16135 [Marinilabiliales bacterium]|nr:MAG: hypothetical protein C0597_16135 [Marinilabiliales bacterium]